MNELILMDDNDKIAAEIKRLHQIVGDAIQNTMIPAAIQAGELLVERKQKYKHGNWGHWLRDNVQFTHKTATIYMRAFYNKSLVAKFTSGLNLPLADFVKLTAKPAEEEKRMQVEANSKRNASRVKYAKKNAIPEVWQALEDEKISIDSADRIAHAPKKSQPEMLEAAIKITRPKPKAKPKTESKLTSFERHQMGLEKAGYTSKPIGLTRQEVDPDFKGDDLAYTAEYGPVVLQTKQQRETERDRHTFSQWIGVVRKLKVPLKELLNADSFSQFHITNWIKRTSDPSKYLMRYTDLEETLILIKQAGESVAGHLEWLPSQKPVGGNGQ